VTARDVHARLAALQGPRAPEALRRRVIERARDVVPAAPTRADRIWFSRSWRLAWAAALLALVVVEWTVVRVWTAEPPAAREHEGTRAAAEIGLPGPVLVGARIVTGDEGDPRQLEL
jgi:hypothetical protein